MSAEAMDRMTTRRRSGILLDRIATAVFCLSALSFGWWLGGGFDKAQPAAAPQSAAAPQPVTRFFMCGVDDENCDDGYLNYLDAERARARAWRHGGP